MHGQVPAAAALRGNPAPPGPVLTALSLLAGGGLYLLPTGVKVSSDSASYAYWSARLVESGFDYGVIVPQAQTSFPAALYALFATLLGLLQIAFGAYWREALVALNLLAYTGVGVLLVRLGVRITGSGAAGWAALLLYLGCFDILHWVPFALSDTTFIFLAFSIFSLAAARILGDARGWGGVAGLAAAAVFYRPTGIVLLPDLALAAWLSRLRKPLRVPAAWAALSGCAIAVAVVVFAAAMQDPARWPFGPLSRAFATVARGYAVGEVVSGRSETFHAPPQQLLDFVLISADRFVHFFAPGASHFSLGHWAVQMLFFLPCYALAAWLVLALCRGTTSFGAAERKVLLAAAGAVMAYALFHALVQVDYDWRYRLPILPHLILLASGGVADLWRRRARR
jgi:hypothetical protein